MTPIPRTAMEAMDRWRHSVRDAAVLALLERCPEPLPLHVIASRIGVDHHGLRAVLEPDHRLAVAVGQCVRPGRGRPEAAIFVRLRHSPGVAAADSGGNRRVVQSRNGGSHAAGGVRKTAQEGRKNPHRQHGSLD